MMKRPMRMNMLIFLVMLILVSCEMEKGNSRIKGSVLKSEELIISEITPGEMVALDTLQIEKNKFSYAVDFDEPKFLLLEFSTGVKIPVLLVPGDKITLDVNDTTDYGSFTAEGSESVRKMAEQRDLVERTSAILDSIDELNYLYQDSADVIGPMRMKWDQILDERFEIHRKALHEIIDRDTTDLSNIMAFYQSVGRIEVLSYDRDKEYYHKVDRGLRMTWPDNKHTKYFHTQLERYETALKHQEQIRNAALTLKEGSQAPEISLANPDGKILNLSDLRGKIVYVDFWASWCGPCRRANPELVKVYNKYRNKGFEIFSVSLDGLDQQANPANDWRYAIEYDGLVWNYHVSDLKGWQSSVVEKYGFEGIPFGVLIDRTGKIVLKGIDVLQLESELKKIL